MARGLDSNGVCTRHQANSINQIPSTTASLYFYICIVTLLGVYLTGNYETGVMREWVRPRMEPCADDLECGPISGPALYPPEAIFPNVVDTCQLFCFSSSLPLCSYAFQVTQLDLLVSSALARATQLNASSEANQCASYYEQHQEHKTFSLAIWAF